MTVGVRCSRARWSNVECLPSLPLYVLHAIGKRFRARFKPLCPAVALSHNQTCSTVELPPVVSLRSIDYSTILSLRNPSFGVPALFPNQGCGIAVSRAYDFYGHHKIYTAVYIAHLNVDGLIPLTSILYGTAQLLNYIHNSLKRRVSGVEMGEGGSVRHTVR